MTRMRRTHWSLAWMAIGLMTACGGSETQRADAADGQAAARESATGGATTADAAATGSPSPRARSVGEVSFELDGEPRTFDYLDPDENFYMRITGSVVAHPERGATERLSISFISFDAGAVDYPADLPAAAKDLSSRAQIGFGYVEPDGDDWTGGGTLHVESLADDGTLIGSFDTIRMSGANNSQMTLSNGRVRARLRKR